MGTFLTLILYTKAASDTTTGMDLSRTTRVVSGSHNAVRNVSASHLGRQTQFALPAMCESRTAWCSLLPECLSPTTSRGAAEITAPVPPWPVLRLPILLCGLH